MLFSRTPFESAVEGFSVLAACSGQFQVPTKEPFRLFDNVGSGIGKNLLATVHACLSPGIESRPDLDVVLGAFESSLAIPLDSSDLDPIFGALTPVDEKPFVGSDEAANMAKPEVREDSDSMDEFGDFESANFVDSDTSNRVVAPPEPPCISEAELNPCTGSAAGSVNVDISEAQTPSRGGILIEGPINVMRPKHSSSFSSHRMVKKQVRAFYNVCMVFM